MGIQTVKVIILKDGTVTGKAKAFSGFEPTKAAEQAFAQALKAAKGQRKKWRRFLPRAQAWIWRLTLQVM